MAACGCCRSWSTFPWSWRRKVPKDHLVFGLSSAEGSKFYLICELLWFCDGWETCRVAGNGAGLDFVFPFFPFSLSFAKDFGIVGSIAADCRQWSDLRNGLTNANHLCYGKWRNSYTTVRKHVTWSGSLID